MIIPVNALPLQKRNILKGVLAKWITCYIEKIISLSATNKVTFEWKDKKLLIDINNTGSMRISIFLKKGENWRPFIDINNGELRGAIELDAWFDRYNFKQVVKKLKLLLKELKEEWTEWKKKN